MQTSLKSMLGSVIGVAALLAAGCGPESTGSGLVTVRLSAVRADASTNTAVAAQNVTTAAAVGLTDVDSLSVTLDSLQVRTSNGDQWQTVITSLDLDLLKLSDTDPIELGEVSVQDGTCEVRLFISDPYIEFGQAVTVGRSTFSGGQPGHSFSVPSGDQTGLKVDGTCDAVTDPTNVTLAFDVGATVGTIVATGSGQIMLTPVIHVVQP